MLHSVPQTGLDWTSCTSPHVLSVYADALGFLQSEIAVAPADRDQQGSRASPVGFLMLSTANCSAWLHLHFCKGLPLYDGILPTIVLSGEISSYKYSLRHGSRLSEESWSMSRRRVLRVV